jgi:Fic family protein
MLASIDTYQKDINEQRPFGAPLLTMIRRYYRVSLTYTSNAIEGFTYTESETKVLLEEGLTVGGKHLRDALAVTGHAKAYDYMFSLLTNNTLVNQDILTMHSLLEGSLESGKAGGYRNVPIFVTGSKHAFTRPEDIETKMKAFEEWMQADREKLHPVEFAVQLHKKLVLIHPFEDGNGRISRLAMNAALIQKGYLPIVVPPILRAEYIASLEAAHTDDTAFKDFMYRQQIEEQKSFLRIIGDKTTAQAMDTNSQVQHVIREGLDPRELEKSMPSVDADKLREELRLAASNPEGWGVKQEEFEAWGKEQGVGRKREVPTPTGKRIDIVYDNF